MERQPAQRRLYLAGRYWIHHKWKAGIKTAEFKQDIRPTILARKALTVGTACSQRWQILHRKHFENLDCIFRTEMNSGQSRGLSSAGYLNE